MNKILAIILNAVGVLVYLFSVATTMAFLYGNGKSGAGLLVMIGGLIGLVGYIFAFMAISKLK
ncbi:hypothetical protein ACFLZX_06135 [Nanoarchaeota archaeon]